MDIVLYPKYLIRSLFVHDRKLFYKAGYRFLYPEYKRHGMTPWQHYVIDGKRKGFDNGNHPKESDFFELGYLAMYPDVAISGMAPWHHYVQFGKKEGRDNGNHPGDDVFFAPGYLEMYLDVAKSGIDPWKHYILYGKKEGRDNGNHPDESKFLASGYLSLYPDVASSRMDPWHHYVQYGKKEGRSDGRNYEADYETIKNSHYFDPVFYKNNHVDLLAIDNLDPVRHYLCYGYKESRKPSPSFDVKEYVRFFKLRNFENPLLHYERVGKFYDEVYKKLVF